MSITYRTVKLSCKDWYDLQWQLGQIEGRILRIKPTVPSTTDTNSWYEVYIECAY